MWWCSNDELPLTTEAATFEQLVSRVLEIAPEIAAENGLAVPGDEIELAPYRKWYPFTGWLAESLLKRLALSSTEPPQLGINGAGRNIARYFDPCRPRTFRASQLRCAARWRARLFSGVAGMSSWAIPSGLSASTTVFMIAAGAPTLPALAGTLDTQRAGLGGTGFSSVSKDGTSSARRRA